jgi:hypothetical protein
LSRYEGADSTQPSLAANGDARLSLARLAAVDLDRPRPRLRVGADPPRPGDLRPALRSEAGRSRGRGRVVDADRATRPRDTDTVTLAMSPVDTLPGRFVTRTAAAAAETNTAATTTTSIIARQRFIRRSSHGTDRRTPAECFLVETRISATPPLATLSGSSGRRKHEMRSPGLTGRVPGWIAGWRPTPRRC